MFTLNDIIVKIVSFIHIIYILFVVATPFTTSTYFLLLHAVTVPFMIAHWLCNDNTCVLTIIERKLRGMEKDKDDNDCFTCKLIEPVYDFNKNYKTFSALIYVLVVSLWLVSAGKLYCGYRSGAISSLEDLFTI